MQPNSPLVLRAPYDRGSEWARFLAALCLLQFYVNFVTWGGALYETWEAGTGITDNAYLAGIGPVQAIVLLLMGRGLRIRRRLHLIWVIVLGAILVVYLMRTENPGWTPWGQNLLAWICTYARHLIWLFMLATLAFSNLRGVRRNGRFPLWSKLAVCWTVGRLVQQCVEVIYFYYWPYGFPPGFALLTTAGLSTLLFLTACLLFGTRLASLAALASGLLFAGTLITYAYAITSLVDTAIGALLASCAYPTVNPIPWPWILLNKTAFSAVAVEAVAEAGPFFVIAYFAWRYPLRLPADDGSPFPRRYCGACGYNLHGVAGPRCPECGAEFSGVGSDDATYADGCAVHHKTTDNRPQTTNVRNN